jgi:hypothetical protein
MYNYSNERRMEEFRFIASVHGVELDGDSSGETTKIEPTEKLVSKGLFGDPADYAKMTDEQKAEATNNMMKKFRGWATQTNLSGEI